MDANKSLNPICSMCNSDADVLTIGIGYMCENCYLELEDSYDSTGLEMDFDEFMGTTWI